MRRIAAIAVLLVAVCVVAVFGMGAGDGEGDAYRVRAIFDNAGFVQDGMDVKVAGVKVGGVAAVDVTEDFKAAVILDITEPGFQDFRSDATCIVRPQSLIGEKYVECEPTQQRPAGAEAPPELPRIDDGPGAGQYLLPVEQTRRSVDLDLVNNIMRLPYRQRLSIILSELGAAVAGRGQDLDQVIRRANPALAETGEVLKILASQNQALADLARDSDTALAPLARERRRVSSFIENATAVGEATVARKAQLQASIQRLPAFLGELEPTMTRLGALADEMTPVMTDLGDVAPEVNRFILELGPFSRAATPAVDTLGDAADVGRDALVASEPVIRDTRRLARGLQPVGDLLAQLLTSVEKTGTINRLMDYLFYQVAAINGFDAFGHYLRAGLIVDQCSTYSTRPVAGCSAQFIQSTSASAASALPRDEVLARTRAVLEGADPRDVLEGTGTVTDAPGAAAASGLGSGTAPAKDSRPADTVPSGPAIAPRSQGGAPDALLDYLLGSDG
jgi:ABC-type transporter Mla subunit MlaD